MGGTRGYRDDADPSFGFEAESPAALYRLTGLSDSIGYAVARATVALLGESSPNIELGAVHGESVSGPFL
jgi:hypothetical protein